MFSNPLLSTWKTRECFSTPKLACDVSSMTILSLVAVVSYAFTLAALTFPRMESPSYVVARTMVLSWTLALSSGVTHLSVGGNHHLFFPQWSRPHSLFGFGVNSTQWFAILQRICTYVAHVASKSTIPERHLPFLIVLTSCFVRWGWRVYRGNSDTTPSNFLRHITTHSFWELIQLTVEATNDFHDRQSYSSVLGKVDWTQRWHAINFVAAKDTCWVQLGYSVRRMFRASLISCPMHSVQLNSMKHINGIPNREPEWNAEVSRATISIVGWLTFSAISKFSLREQIPL